jgi:hypothetical protein
MKDVQWQSTQYWNNLCEKQESQNQDPFTHRAQHQIMIDEPFQKTTCHLSFWIEWKHFRNQIQWEYNQYELHLHSEQYIEKDSKSTYNWSYKK